MDWLIYFASDFQRFWLDVWLDPPSIHFRGKEDLGIWKVSKIVGLLLFILNKFYLTAYMEATTDNLCKLEKYLELHDRANGKFIF